MSNLTRCFSWKILYFIFCSFTRRLQKSMTILFLTVGVIYLERDKSLERLTLHAYFLHLKLKIIFFKFTKYSMFTDRIIKIIFFDNSFIVKIYVKKMNFFKCHFFSIGDTAVADRLRAFSKSVLGSPFRGLPTSLFWGGVLGNFFGSIFKWT